MVNSLNKLTASELSILMAAGEVRSAQVVQHCLDRVAAREATVHAWAHIDPQRALAAAEVLDSMPRRGPLHGVPIGVKDVLDTADMPTQMGSEIYSGHQPSTDSSVVALLRAAGAVILGKTVAAEFAGMAPAVTRNPLDIAHTPGGSSSGSAAAVADMMAPVALGTQTGGSVLRPASYCGVVGFKPTYGRVNRAGLKFGAESLDTIGWMGRSISDIALIDAVLTGRSTQPLVPVKPARIGLCHTYMWSLAMTETKDAVENAASRLAAAGVVVDRFELPSDFDALSKVREVINDYERARGLAHEWSHDRERISPQLSLSVSRGYEISHSRYVEALQCAEQARLRLDTLAFGYDALLAPCVNGEAPLGLESGDHSFQSLWTLLHVPAVGLPTHRGPQGLPVSVQIVGRRYADERLLQVALSMFKILCSSDAV